jgi:hypothetical protein
MSAAIVLLGLVAAMVGGLAALAAGYGLAALGVYALSGVASGLVVAIAAARTEQCGDASGNRRGDPRS